MYSYWALQLLHYSTLTAFAAMQVRGTPTVLQHTNGFRAAMQVRALRLCCNTLTASAPPCR